jgi:HSP20 family protein
MLMRFDPFREFDALTQQLWPGVARTGTPMDAYRRGEEFIVEFDLPGVDPSSIDLTVEENVLTVNARRERHFGDDDEVLVSERPYGEISRQLFLGDTLDTDSINASYDNGVLTLRLPVADKAKPRKIEIGAGHRQKELVGSAS